MATAIATPASVTGAQGTSKPTGELDTSPSSSPPVVPIRQAPFKIRPVRRSSRWVKMMIYGPVGIGKTTLAGSAADVDSMADVLLIDAEAGDMTLDQNPRIKHIDRISQVQVNSFIQVGMIHDFLKAHCEHRDTNDVEKLRKNEAWLAGVDVESIKEPKRFRTVIIDTLTEVEAYNMYKILDVDQEKLLKADMASEDFEMAGWGEFRKNKMMVEALVRAFRDLPMHVILVLHQSYTEDEVKRKSYMPMLTGKLATSVQGLMDIVGYLRDSPPIPINPQNPQQGTRTVKRLFVRPSNVFAAKCRMSSFTEEYFDDPTMSSIMKRVGLLQ